MPQPILLEVICEPLNEPKELAGIVHASAYLLNAMCCYKEGEWDNQGKTV